MFQTLTHVLRYIYVSLHEGYDINRARTNGHAKWIILKRENSDPYIQCNGAEHLE